MSKHNDDLTAALYEIKILRDEVRNIQKYVLDPTVERRIRERLWLSHGHGGQYGDDGEMQCGECMPFGVADYKRTPLKDLLDAMDKVGYAQLVKMNAAIVDGRDPECVQKWPSCHPGTYDPRCCRFPKSCSCTSVPVR